MSKKEKKEKKQTKTVSETSSSSTETISSNSWTFFAEQKNVNAISYVPYFIGPAIAYFFSETNDRKQMMHHINYSIILAVVAVILIVLLKWFFGSIVNFSYIAASIYFGMKAYKWEEVKVEILDSIEEKISEKVK